LSREHWFERIATSKRDFWIIFILLFNAFTWFYMALMIIDRVPLNFKIVSAFRTIFYIATIGSSIAGSLLVEKIERLHLLYLWMTLGIASSLLLINAYNAATGYLAVIFLLLGVSFGLGMPSCLAYLADHTPIENRGLTSSVVFFAANLGALPVTIAFMNFDLTINAIILTVWRGLGLISLVFLKKGEKGNKPGETEGKHISFMSIFHDRSFILYLLPWVMFCLIDILEKTVLENFSEPDFQRLIQTIGPVIASFSIVIGGLLADRLGRKRVVIYGFVSLGLAYAIIGIAPTLMIAWYFYLIIDGIAAGILWLAFVLILWGDLSKQGAREKYYAIGSSPFFVRPIIPFFLAFLIQLIPASAAFSLASFFLFLAVLPLVYAPETLPEKKIQLRKLRSYTETAKKFREKYLKKSASG
jgi:MFS family permease